MILSNLFILNEPFQNIKALNHKNKYFINDVLVVDTIILNSRVKDGATSYNTTIRGKLINSNILKDITFLYKNHDYNNYIFKYKKTNQDALKVYRNILNDNIFLKDYEYLNNKKTGELLKIYFICSLLPALTLLIILMKMKR